MGKPMADTADTLEHPPTLVDWREIRTAPIGPTILLAHAGKAIVVVGYGEWFDAAPVPRFIAVEPTGYGRFGPTHWANMPAPPAVPSDAEISL